MLNFKDSKKSLSTKEKTEAIHSASVEPKKNLTQSWKCYSSTQEISCHIFWRTIIDGNLSRLIYDGGLTKEDRETDEIKAILAAAWQDILIEHAETISNDAVYSGQQVVGVEKRALIISWAASAILYLKKDYHKELNAELKRIFRSSGVQLDYSNPFQYQRDLERCSAVAKSWQFELTKQQDVISARYDNQNKKSELSYKAFAKTLIPMSKFMGGKILNARELMVYDYDLIYSQMIEQAESENK